MFEPGQHAAQLSGCISRVKCRRVPGFSEFLPIGFDDKRQMQIARVRQSQRLLQRQLPPGTRQQISAAHHIRYSLLGIVDHRGKLIGMYAITATHDDISLLRGIKAYFSQAPIDDRDGHE